MILSWQTKLLAGLFGLASIPVLAFLVLMVWPIKPMVVHSLVVDKPVIERGELIPYTINLTRYTDKPAQIIRQLVNTRVTTYAPIIGALGSGKQVRRSTIETALSDMPGEYYLRWTAIFTYWGIREVVVSIESNRFNLK